MIPLSLTLEGFLSYRERASLTFLPDRILLLSGPNNVGKSSIFDAMLFALYAGGRVDGEPSLDLINERCDQALVEFEFQLNGERYKAVRSLRRKRDAKDGSETYEQKPQLFEWHEVKKGEPWKPVKGATKVREFQQWVSNNLGLSYHAFTSSVLLLQGKAETLIDQDRKAAERRFDVLSRLVGLSYFQQLHQRAVALRTTFKEAVRDLGVKLEGTPAVKPEDIEQAGRDIAAKDDEIAAAAAEVARLEACRERAAEWGRVQQEQRVARQVWDEAAALLGDADAIERAGKRQAELAYVMPYLNRIVEQREVRAKAQAEFDRIDRELGGLIGGEEKLIAKLDEIDRDLLVGEQRRETAEREKQVLADKRAEYSQALPPLKRICANRVSLGRERPALAELRATLDAAVRESERLHGEIAPLAAAVEAAEKAVTEARDAVTQAKGEVKVVEDRAGRLASVSGAKECIYCGHALTEEHIAEEQGHIEERRRECAATLERATATWNAAIAAKDKAAAAHRDAIQKHEAARKLAEEFARQGEHAEKDVATHIRTLVEAYEELAPRLRTKVAAEAPVDWLVTTFPTAEDLARCEKSLETWAAQIKAHDQTIKSLKEAAARLTTQKQGTEKDRALLGQKVNAARVARSEHLLRVQHAEQAGAEARESLPAEWRVRADALDGTGHGELQTEFRGLQESDAAGRWAKLQTVTAGQELLRQRRDSIDATVAAFPAEDRRSVDEVARELAAAQKVDRERHADKVKLEAHREALEKRRVEREALNAEYAREDRKRLLAEKLAELLGPKNLQRHLLHEAEVQIVDNTNELLGKLASHLYLRLLPEDENEKSRALQLVCDKPAEGVTRGLAYLSSSEKFRIAVSLALGVGRYASRQHRPIECVIIDEGFGCLDRKNREVMIEEIGKLSGLLRSVMLVSHQEEFADAFPDGFRFALEGDTTRVTPVGS